MILKEGIATYVFFAVEVRIGYMVLSNGKGPYFGPY
jgi:hypothetical protein